MPEYPGTLHHRTPGWVRDGALFHIRIRAASLPEQSLSELARGSALLGAVRHYHDSGRWWCELALLMPDHLPALVACPREPGLAMTVRDWKRGTARLHGVKWQDNFFDHRIRHPKEGNETWHYIRLNPVVKGLCPTIEDWPYWWSGAQDTGGAACPSTME
jgi:putative transposase